jgi:hypothetical protein
MNLHSFLAPKRMCSMFQARFLLCSDLISFKKCFFLPFFSFLFFVFDSSRRSQRRQSKNDCLRNLFQSSRISSGSFLIFALFSTSFVVISLSRSLTLALYTHISSLIFKFRSVAFWRRHSSVFSYLFCCIFGVIR